MVYKNDHAVYIKCGCGCGGLDFHVTKQQDEEEYWISLTSDRFYSEQNHGWAHWQEKIKKLWCVLCGKDYCYMELIMTKQEFADFVQTLQEIKPVEE